MNAAGAGQDRPPTPLRVLVGEGVRRLRVEAGLAQADLASVADGRYGLAWNRAKISSIEAGQKPINVEELASLVAILREACNRPDLTIGDLIEKRRLVALSPAVALPSQALVLLLQCDLTSDGRDTLSGALEVAGIPAPVPDATVRPVPARTRAGRVPRAPEGGYPRFAPVVVPSRRPDDADRRAAARLGTTPEAVRETSLRLWRHNLATERDRLLAERTDRDDSPARRQALRGRITRDLVAEIEQAMPAPRRRRKSPDQ